MYSGVSVCESRYFLVDADGKVLLNQDGTFRSNCMDCLDRTNVIQSLLARRALQSQLQVGGGGNIQVQLHDAAVTLMAYQKKEVYWKLEA